MTPHETHCLLHDLRTLVKIDHQILNHDKLLYDKTIAKDSWNVTAEEKIASWFYFFIRWSGYKTRLNRELHDDDYENIVGILGKRILCNHFELTSYHPEKRLMVAYTKLYSDYMECSLKHFDNPKATLKKAKEDAKKAASYVIDRMSGKNDDRPPINIEIKRGLAMKTSYKMDADELLNIIETMVVVRYYSNNFWSSKDENILAYYSCGDRDDFICMRTAKSYFKKSDFFSVLFHELIHWTGHVLRLDRESFYEYNENRHYEAYEELVADFGSIKLCRYFGYEVSKHMYGNIDYYTKRLKKPKTSLKQVEKDAEEAVDYILKKLLNSVEGKHYENNRFNGKP
jgi:hypothetical protein